MLRVSLDLWLLCGLIEAAIKPPRQHVNPNKHRDINLIGTLLFNFELIDDCDGCRAEHEVDPDTPKQG